jgi:hypothetical protein
MHQEMDRDMKQPLYKDDVNDILLVCFIIFILKVTASVVVETIRHSSPVSWSHSLTKIMLRLRSDCCVRSL